MAVVRFSSIQRGLHLEAPLSYETQTRRIPQTSSVGNEPDVRMNVRSIKKIFTK